MVFSNIFGFPAVNWAPKWTKTVNIGCIPFEPKCENLKDFSNSVYLTRDYLWSKFPQDWTIFGGVRGQKTLKRGHFIDFEATQKTLKIFNFKIIKKWHPHPPFLGLLPFSGKKFGTPHPSSDSTLGKPYPHLIRGAFQLYELWHPKDAVFAEILVLGNIFGFLKANWISTIS